MPVPDWTRVKAGIFHDFLCGLIVAIRNALNDGLLPPDYYAMVEQHAGNLGPDVLTLQAVGPDGEVAARDTRGATAVATALPKVRFTATAEMDKYVLKQWTRSRIDPSQPGPVKEVRR